MNKASFICAHVAVLHCMANDVRREAIEDRLRRRREHDKIEERENQTHKVC